MNWIYGNRIFIGGEICCIFSHPRRNSAFVVRTFVIHIRDRRGMPKTFNNNQKQAKRISWLKWWKVRKRAPGPTYNFRQAYGNSRRRRGFHFDDSSLHKFRTLLACATKCVVDIMSLLWDEISHIECWIWNDAMLRFSVFYGSAPKKDSEITHISSCISTSCARVVCIPYWCGELC